jgi:hypothetical protein
MSNKLLILTTLSLLVLSAPCALGQKRGDSRRTVTVRDFELVQDKQMVTIDFTLDVGSKATRSRNTLVVIPVLTATQGSDKHIRELTPVVVWGKKAKILYDRRSIASPFTTKTIAEPDVLFAENGVSVAYSVSFPFEEWMVSSELALDGVYEGCCSAERRGLGVIASDLMVPPEAFMVEETVVVPGRVLTTGEKLAKLFPFVKPAWSAPTRGGIIIYFHQGRHNIDQNYRNNRQKLIDILSVVEELRQSVDSEVEGVLIEGYASPEDTYDNNMGLSERRSNQVRRYIYDNSPLDRSLVTIYRGGEDWEGLRAMVAASDMPDREAVIDIIDRVPIWDSRRGVGREGELMRLRGGEAYRFMYRYYFPELRNAAYITVYYKDK